MGPRSLILVLFVLSLAGCPGPDAEVRDVRLEAPSRQGEPYRVEAQLENERYAGTVNVIFRLRAADGTTYEEEKIVALEKRQRVRAVAEVHAPPGDYTPEVEVDYPP